MEEILKELGVDLAPEDHHHCTPNYLQTDCPKCSPGSKKYRLGIHRSGWRASCWVCGRLPLVEMLALLAPQSSLNDLQSMLKGIVGVYPSPDQNNRFEGQVIAKNRPLNTVKPIGCGQLLPIHKRFLERRHFDPPLLIRDWEIEGIGLSDKYSWRLFIPVLLDKKLVSWTTRSCNHDHAIRYRSAESHQESIPHKSLLYGEDRCGTTCIVVEGPLDVWTLGKGSTCTFGIAYTADQILRIARFPIRIICYDNEPQAQKQAVKLCNELSIFPGTTLNVVFETGKDPSRAKKQEVQEFTKRFMES
jgi:hypothetical protein